MVLLGLTACNTVQQSLDTQVESDGTLHRTLRQNMYDKKQEHRTITPALSLLDTRNYTLVKQERKGDSLTTLLELQDQVWNSTYAKRVAPGPFIVTSQPSMKRRFRWFTTQWEYRETFSVHIPPFPVPWSRYLTREEMTYWIMGTPRLTDGLSGSETNELLYTIKEKFGKWRKACEFEWQYATIVKHYDRIKNAPMSKIEFMRQHDSMLNLYLATSKNISDDQKLQNVLTDVFHSQAYQILLNDSAIMAPVNARIEQLIAFANFRLTCRWSMPGQITSAENVIVIPSGKDGEQILSLNLTGERMLLGTYTVTVETETRNIWAWILTIAVVPGLLLGNVIRKKRKSDSVV